MITTIRGFISKIRKQISVWEFPQYVWFRGEPDVETRLLPKLYRPKSDGLEHNENKLLQMFRMKAPSFAPGLIPPRENIDEWLFLAQHVGLPTRLLDWSENSLLALYFALKQDKPVVWMLDPMALNTKLKVPNKPIKHDKIIIEKFDEFPLTWFRPKLPSINIGHDNIRRAWEADKGSFDLPVAVHPTYIHPRMLAQRSVFTIHGGKKEPIDALVDATIIAKFEILPKSRQIMLNDLSRLGIQESDAFPDLDGLARELATIY